MNISASATGLTVSMWMERSGSATWASGNMRDCNGWPALWFGTHEKQWGITGSTEQRVRVSANRVRVPESWLVPAAGVQPDVLTDPPLLVIEILSPRRHLLRHTGARAGLSRNGCGDGLDYRSQDAHGTRLLGNGLG